MTPQEREIDTLYKVYLKHREQWVQAGKPNASSYEWAVKKAAYQSWKKAYMANDMRRAAS